MQGDRAAAKCHWGFAVLAEVVMEQESPAVQEELAMEYPTVISRVPELVGSESGSSTGDVVPLDDPLARRSELVRTPRFRIPGHRC